MNDWLNRVRFGDCLESLRRMPDGFVNTCVTSPPYFGLRDYGHDGQIGMEETPEAFIAKLVEVFREVRRVLRDDGTCWVNMGDSYAAGKARLQEDCEAGGQRWANRQSECRAPGLKAKDLIGVPWMLAFALRADGWYLRQDIIWSKPNPMPESVRDRCTKAHEYIFLLSKSASYYCDMEAIKEPSTFNPVDWNEDGTQRRKSHVRGEFRGKNLEPGKEAFRAISADRNKRSVWTVATRPYKGAHFATFPTDLIEPCILAGAPAGGVVLDPFFGSGTTGEVCERLGRAWIGLELNSEFKPLQDDRLRQRGLVLEPA